MKYRRGALKMKKQSKILIIVGVIAIALILSFLISVIVLTPKADKIEFDGISESYFITNATYIDYQEENDCSAYAAAYMLRCLGNEIDGKQLYPQMKRHLGMMTVKSVENALEKQGYSAKAYHGSIDSLKQRPKQGKPVICFIRNGKDTHYVVGVGYDKEYIYLVDSIKENANVSDSYLYNRKVEIKDFEQIWKNNFYTVNNIYIV